jgi:DNA-directed RNA polymerase specialized sigma24 family protein
LPFLNNISNSGDDDQDLVSSYQRSKDLAILGTLYQRYMDLVYGVCLKYLGEPETAKDAVMAIFEELAQKLHKHQVTYLYPGQEPLPDAITLG